MKEENKFSDSLRKKGSMSPGGEWGWKLADIPDVVKECQKLNYAILGGQIQFQLPGATCELYWLKADPKEWASEESWTDYSIRSCTEFLTLFNELVKKTDFEKEALEWPVIKAKKESGVNILEYMCFMIYPVSEQRYKSMS